MKKLLLALFFAIFLSACNKSVVVEPATSIVQLNLPRRPELDLAQYKVWFHYESDAKVCISMDEVRKLNELHVILLNRIRLDEAYIREYKKYYEKSTK